MELEEPLCAAASLAVYLHALANWTHWRDLLLKVLPVVCTLFVAAICTSLKPQNQLARWLEYILLGQAWKYYHLLAGGCADAPAAELRQACGMPDPVCDKC